MKTKLGSTTRWIAMFCGCAMVAGSLWAASESVPENREEWLGAMGSFGSHFEVNAGHLPPEAQFCFRGDGYRFDLLKNGIALATDRGNPLAPHPMTIQFSGARADAQAEGRTLLPFRVQQPTAREHASRKIVSVPAYQAVRMDGMYDGIDVDYQVQKGNLQYDFIVAAGASPDAIALKFHGASTVRFDEDGNLAIDLGNGMVLQHKPYLYQVIEGKRVPVEGEYVQLPSKEIGIRVGAYDASVPLIIDPVLSVILDE